MSAATGAAPGAQHARDSITPQAIASAAALAAQRCPGFIRRTPLWRLPGSTLGVDCAEVWLKLEHLQTAGSFKARGMLHRLLSQPIPAAGVIVASGGNAGIATAAAAQRLGVPCEVFLPEVSSQAKRERLRALGARVVVHGAAYAQALQACMQRQRETGALMTHAYDQSEVVTGAGALALEIEHDAAAVPDQVLVSVGGGGLIAGVASWFQGRSRVVALEPRLAPTLWQARQAGAPVDVEVGGIAADSLGARRIGDIAWAVQRQHVAESLVLDDDAIRDAQLWLWREMKLAVEPAAALGLAALRTGAVRPRAQERVALIICGANVDPSSLQSSHA